MPKVVCTNVSFYIVYEFSHFFLFLTHARKPRSSEMTVKTDKDVPLRRKDAGTVCFACTYGRVKFICIYQN